MAARQPKPKLADDASTACSPLKPNTEKAKVEKVKSNKPKVEKAGKVVKPKAIKVKTTPTSDDEDDEHGEPSAAVVKPTKAKAPAKKAAEKDAKDARGKDGKEKVKAVVGEEAVELMARYLKEQNRPYSATEVSANLHGKVTKTVADKLLKEMEQNGLIMAKATNGTNKGSQWVFWAKQDVADAASPEALAAMDTSISSIREILPALKSSLKIVNTKLQTLRSAPTTSQLATLVEKLREANAVKAAKLEGFKNGTMRMVTKEEVEKVEKDFKYWGMKRKARMNAYKNLEAQLLEGMSKEDIEEKVGIEADTYDA